MKMRRKKIDNENNFKNMPLSWLMVVIAVDACLILLIMNLLNKYLILPPPSLIHSLNEMQ